MIIQLHRPFAALIAEPVLIARRQGVMATEDQHGAARSEFMEPRGQGHGVRGPRLEPFVGRGGQVFQVGIAR